MQDLNDLSRQIAAKNPQWAQPGMRCVDPETGHGYRHIGEGDLFDEQETCNVGWRGDGEEPGCDRAIANGPDHTDAATLGALLLGLGEDRLLGRAGVAWFVGYFPPRWECPAYMTRAEAILRAVLASLEGK